MTVADRKAGMDKASHIRTGWARSCSSGHDFATLQFLEAVGDKAQQLLLWNILKFDVRGSHRPKVLI